MMFPARMVAVSIAWLDGAEGGAYHCGEQMDGRHRIAIDLVDSFAGEDWPISGAEEGPSLRVQPGFIVQRLLGGLGTCTVEGAW